jgi:cell division protein FtsN
MFKGRMYAVCETFGRYGADGKPASQEYLLNEATIWGAKKPEGEPAAEPEKPQEKPAIPAQAQQQNKPAKPAQEPAPKPAQQPKQPATEAGWGFFK